jgi:hypothetical protein
MLSCIFLDIHGDLYSKPGFFLDCMQLESTQKKFLATNGIKIQEFFRMKKPNVNHGL